MGQLNIHEFTEDVEKQGQDPLDAQSSYELRKAKETSELCGRLLNRLGVSEESALLLVPFRDGPLGALFTLNQLIEEGKNVDNIVPAYLKNPANYSRMQPWVDDRFRTDDQMKNSLPLSMTYEGGSGEILLNSVRSFRNLSEREEQIAANVQIHTNRIRFLQTSISDFEGGFDVDFGYRRDSSQPSSAVDKFPQSWDLSEEGEHARALLRNLLVGAGKFGDSPLRSVEIIRALIIARIGKFDESPSMVDLYNPLDTVYPNLEGVSNWDHNARNTVTKALVRGMTEGKIIETKGGGKTTTYQKGPAWSSYSDLFGCYLDYYDNELDWEWNL